MIDGRDIVSAWPSPKGGVPRHQSCRRLRRQTGVVESPTQQRRARRLLDLIFSLHKNTGAQVRLSRYLSQHFLTTSGVRQGCVLAPAVFCVAINWILRHNIVSEAWYRSWEDQLQWPWCTRMTPRSSWSLSPAWQVSAHMALWCNLDLTLERPLSREWKRPPGQPHYWLIDQIQEERHHCTCRPLTVWNQMWHSTTLAGYAMTTTTYII